MLEIIKENQTYFVVVDTETATMSVFNGEALSVRSKRLFEGPGLPVSHGTVADCLCG